MTTFRHPATGVELNEIPITRTGALTEAERHTAQLLMAAGEPRWLAAARLGVHPLVVPARDSATKPRNLPRGNRLSARDTRADPRQSSMDDLLGAELPRRDKA